MLVCLCFCKALGLRLLCVTQSVEQLSGLQKKGDIEQVLVIQVASSDEHAKAELSPEVQDILQQFQDVFSDPAGLPPKRDCDHTIQLIEGAQPVQIRPYRHTPHVKDEIE